MERDMKRTTPHNDNCQQHPGPAVRNLCLFSASETAPSIAAPGSLQSPCEQHLAGKHLLEALALINNPRLAAADRIISLPNWLRRLPPPMKKTIGDSTNTQPLAGALDLLHGKLPE